jgi:hypothetical protein
MKASTLPRKSVVLPECTQRLLAMYAVSATAAGVGMLALAQPAEAKIVYTPAHIEIPYAYRAYQLDLNHDGVVDFWIGTDYSNGHTWGGQIDLYAAAPWATQSRNKVATVKSKNGGDILARALKAGVRIGPKQVKPPNSAGDLVHMQSWVSNGSRHSSTTGKWINVKKRFLGLAFQVDGKMHYGWARLNVKVQDQYPPITATLTGYAYETVPGKAIIAGKTKGPDVITLPVDTKAGTLGHLALGRK